MIEPKDVTIVIPHLGNDEQQEYAFEQCMHSLEETMPKGMKYTVAKNGLTTCKHVVDVNILPQGQCKAVNAAVATTNTEWIFVTNDDMIYPPGWWEKLCIYDNHGQGCVSPKLVEPRSGAPTFIEYFCGGAGGDFDKEKFLDYVRKHEHGLGFNSGFNLPFLIRRDIWDTVGGYDINYDPWGSNSDSDLEYKIKLAGIQPIQNQYCLVYHFSQTSGTFEPRNQEAWQKNWDYFIEKWGFPRTDDGIWEATFEIPDEGRKFRPEWESKYK